VHLVVDRRRSSSSNARAASAFAIRGGEPRRARAAEPMNPRCDSNCEGSATARRRGVSKKLRPRVRDPDERSLHDLHRDLRSRFIDTATSAVCEQCVDTELAERVRAVRSPASGLL
jgi:hypothetical protein